MARIDYGALSPTTPGAGWTLSGSTGTMAAALAASTNIFTMRSSTVSTNLKAALITRVRLQFTTITAFGTPVTAARRLGLFKFTHASGASNGNPSANNTNIVPVPFNAADTSSVFTLVSATPEWASVDIATTAAMTMGSNMSVSATPLRVLNLVHVGAAGGNVEAEWTFPTRILLPNGTGITIQPMTTMDATGTFHLAVAVDWSEVGTYT